MGIITPGEDETFVGWILRLVSYIVVIVFVFVLGPCKEDEPEPERKQCGSPWKNLDPSRPLSDIIHLDYSTGIVTYCDTGKYIPKGEKRKITPSPTYGGKTLEEIFLDNDLANDYDDLYEMYRD